MSRNYHSNTKSNKRPCDTVIVNSTRHGSKPYREVEEGRSFIKCNPSKRENPCVYFKSTSTHAIHQGGNSNPTRFDADERVIPVTVVETHIKVPNSY